MKRLTKQQIAKIRKLKAQGQTPSYIAAKLGISSTTVWYYTTEQKTTRKFRPLHRVDKFWRCPNGHKLTMDYCIECERRARPL